MNDLDRLSSLPDEVFGHLLSFLPTRCAVRTSVLSTRWRYAFTLAACLTLDDAPCLGDIKRNETEVEASCRRFKEFVDKVLELHRNSPIRKFTLFLHHTYGDSVVNQWFRTVALIGVQELDYIDFARTHRLPYRLFMCENLVSLKIRSMEKAEIEIPLSPSLPKLKILHLNGISFVDLNSMERLFSSCELLRELILKSCNCKTSGRVFHCTGILEVLTIERCCFLDGTLEIDAPNLVYLNYHHNKGVKIVSSWKYSSSFVKAELGLGRKFSIAYGNNIETDTNWVKNLVENDRELLKAAAYKTTSLCFHGERVQILLKVLDDEQMPDFDSLSTLEFVQRPRSWKYVTRLVDKCPQLETVVFAGGFHCCECYLVRFADQSHCYYESDSEPLPDMSLLPFSCRAGVIEVRRFCGHERSLSLMGHLLRNASMLKKLIVHTVFGLDLEDEMKITNDVLMLPRASMDCCVFINKVKKSTPVP